MVEDARSMISVVVGGLMMVAVVSGPQVQIDTWLSMSFVPADATK